MSNTALQQEPAVARLVDTDTETLLALWQVGGRSEWSEALLRRELRARGMTRLQLLELVALRPPLPEPEPAPAWNVLLAERLSALTAGLAQLARRPRRIKSKHLHTAP